MKKTTRTLAIANLIGLSAVLIMNYLANALPLNGKSTGELSDQYPNLFTPAPVTFAIWGVIYGWLLVWGAFQLAALFNQKVAAKMEPMLDKIGWLFAYSCLLNIAWLFAWHWEQVLIALAILANMLYILTQLNRAAAVGISTTSKLEKWLEHVPLGIYQGWLSVAVIANATAWLVSLGWSGSGIAESVWAIIMVLIGGLLAIFMVFRLNNLGHGLAVAWALFGIYLKRIDGSESGSETVAWVALAMMAAVIISLALRWRKLLSY